MNAWMSSPDGDPPNSMGRPVNPTSMTPRLRARTAAAHVRAARAQLRRAAELLHELKLRELAELGSDLGQTAGRLGLILQDFADAFDGGEGGSESEP